jgi:hypothetical protein
MTCDPSPNPYDAPTFADLPYAPPGKPPRSGWLVAICVVAMALGGLGALKALSSFCFLPFQNQLQSAFNPRTQPGLPEEFQEAQDNLQKQVDAVQGRYLIGSLVLAAARLVVALSLLYGGIMALRQTQWGRRTLSFAFAGALPSRSWTRLCRR